MRRRGHAKTQDFLLVRSRTMPFRDAREFTEIATAGSTFNVLARSVLRLGPLRGLSVLKQLMAGLSAPMTSLATTTFYSPVPIQAGRYAARFALVPNAKHDGTELARVAPDHLTEELAARLAREDVSYDFRMQYFVDEARTPIEDATAEWDEAVSPMITVARLGIPRTDVASEAARAVQTRVEAFSFDPWHALVAHRPLGHFMRARNHAYRLSGAERSAGHEPED
jgi:hypothetical protein